MIEVVAPLVGAGLGVVVLGGLAFHQERHPLVRRELRFPTNVAESDVIAVLSGLSGLPTGGMVILEIIATESRIVHVLEAPPGVLELVAGQLRGLLPGLRLDDAESGPVWSRTVSPRWRGAHVLLRTDAVEEASAALLGSFLPIHRGEMLGLRWTLHPARRPRVPEVAGRRQHVSVLDRLLGAERPNDEVQRLRAKYAGPLLEGVLTVGVRAAHSLRQRQLLGRLVAVVRARGAHGAALEVLRRGGRRRCGVFSPAELAGLVGWPVDAPRVAGLSLGTAPQLLPSPRLPEHGRVVGTATWPGMERPVAQPIVGGLSHGLVVGPTGVGKSALMMNLIAQDLNAGRGCLVIDGKGDLVEDVLGRVPKARLDDMVVLDPGRAEPTPGLRVFSADDDAELTADLVLGVFRDLFAGSWGPRSEHWLRAGLVTLASSPGVGLAELPLLFSDVAFRRSLVGRLNDPLLLATWASFEAMSAAERAHQLAAPLNKVEQLVGRRRLRAVLAQPEPSLDLSEVLRRAQVVLVSLAPSRIGAPAARLLGALVVYQLFQAVQARGALAPEARRPFFVYVDEPKVLGDVPVPLDSLFELARGMGVGLTLAAQSVSQLPQGLQRALLTNASTVIAFRQGADDARLLSRELPGVTPDELQHLPQFEAAARIGLGPGDVAPTMTVRTSSVPKVSSDSAAVRRRSAEHYGQAGDAVEARFRTERRSAGDEPVGRKRRSS